MGRPPSSSGAGVKKGPWTVEEDRKLIAYISSNGHGSWRALPKLAGLNRDGKSCRLRWTNYLRPDIKRGKFSDEEEQLVIELHSVLGNKWSAIATRLPGRTDNEIKNYWNTHIRKKLIGIGIDPITHQPRPDLTLMASLPSLLASAVSLPPPFADATQLARLHLVQTLVQVLAAGSSSSSTTNNGSLLYNNQSTYGFSNPMNSIGFLQAPDQIPNTYGSRSLTGGDELVPMIISDGSQSNMLNLNNYTGAISIANSTASLASTSPENLVVDQMIKFKDSKDDNNCKFPSNESIIPETLERLELDDLISGESFWNEVLSQPSSPNWEHGTSEEDYKFNAGNFDVQRRKEEKSNTGCGIFKYFQATL